MAWPPPSAPGARLVQIPGVGAALYAAAPAGAPTVVHFHGNGEDLRGAAPMIALLRSLGVGALAVEYPGYGLESAASSSEASLLASAESALGWLRAEGIEERNIVLQVIIHGAEDEVVPVAMGRALARLFPHATLRVLPGTHHNDLLANHAYEVQEALGGFLLVAR